MPKPVPSKLKQHKQQWLMEDVAAISALVHQDKRYKLFYATYADAIGGFTGVWIWCANAGMAFHKVIDPLCDAKPEEFEWLEIVQDYVGSLLDAALLEGAHPNGDAVLENDWLEPIATAVAYRHSLTKATS